VFGPAWVSARPADSRQGTYRAVVAGQFIELVIHCEPAGLPIPLYHARPGVGLRQLPSDGR